MKVGDRVVYKGYHNYPGFIYDRIYTISELIEDEYENDYVVIVEGNPDVYAFLSDFKKIKTQRKLKLQKINESRG